MEYQQASRKTPSTSTPTSVTWTTIARPTASHAALAQVLSMSRMINDLIRTLSDRNITPTSSGTTTDDVEYSTLSPEQKLEADTKIAEAEWVCFTSIPIISKPEELSDFDMLGHWQVSGFNVSATVYLICLQNAKKNLPLLYAAAMDVLRMQASSVPCKRVFSSSKETDTLRQSQLSPEMMEMFQVLKFQYCSRRLEGCAKKKNPVHRVVLF